jgi:RNA polymerase sigma-70 factor (ECF subfamily)
MVLCKSYAKNDEDAVEILQDGFLKVFQQIESYDAKQVIYLYMDENDHDPYGYRLFA